MNAIWIALIVILVLIAGIAAWQLLAIAKAAMEKASSQEVAALRERVQALEATAHGSQSPGGARHD